MLARIHFRESAVLTCICRGLLCFHVLGVRCCASLCLWQVAALAFIENKLACCCMWRTCYRVPICAFVSSTGCCAPVPMTSLPYLNIIGASLKRLHISTRSAVILFFLTSSVCSRLVLKASFVYFHFGTSVNVRAVWFFIETVDISPMVPPLSTPAEPEQL